jgi:hypothetical protein
MARSIDEVGKGDYVKISPHRYEKIESIDFGHNDRGRTNSWSINTESGLSVGMWNARSYHKAGDLTSEQKGN